MRPINLDKLDKKQLGFNLITILFSLIGLMAFCQPYSFLRQGKIYVSPKGANWKLGHSPAHAVKTIQHAVNIAVAGEEIVLLPGTYQEVVHVRRGGKINQPITIRAQQPGTVKVTNAASQDIINNLDWQEEGQGIVSAKTPWPVHYVLHQENALYYSRTNIDKFRSLVTRKGSQSAFLYDDVKQKLYLYLAPEQPLNNLTIPTKLPSLDKFGNSAPAANFWIEADHLIIEGIQFELGVGTGILLWDGSNIEIRDCLFYGATYGVASNYGISPANNILLEHNLYHNYPQYDWFENWLSWREVYSTGGRSSLANLKGIGVIIRNNIIAHAGDGLQVSPQEQSSTSVGAEIYNNLFFKGTDDAIELDGYARNVHIYSNIIYDFFVSLGISPVLAGPVTIEDNYFFHPYENENTDYPAHLKLLNPWFNPNDPTSDRNIIRNVQILNNVFVGNWLSWHGSPVKNVIIKNNKFSIQRTMEPVWPHGATIQNNQINHLPLSGYRNPGTDNNWLNQKDWEPIRPGPTWLNYQDHPATEDIEHLISPRLVE